MRKLLVFSFITLLGSVAFIACNDEIGDEITQKIAEPTSEYYQPYDSALVIALRQLDACYPGTRSHIQRTVKEHYLYSPSPSTRATETDPVRFHVINFENGQGFAIVSADKRTTPVYAYSPTGNIDLQEAIWNSGVGEFMECAELYFQDEIEQFGGGPLTPFDPDSSLIDLMLQVPVIVDGIECVQRHSTAYENRGPLLTTAWHQSWPYNYFCPTYVDSLGNTRNCPAGCGPVAMGQILAHYRYPVSYDGYNFNWDEIRRGNIEMPNDTCKARLIRLIGLVCNSSYGENVTSTYLSNIRSAFQQMGYSVSQIVSNGSGTRQNVKSNTTYNSPLLFYGYNTAEDEGHFWVVDGYQSTKQQTIYYYAYYPYPEYKTVTNSETVYYSCNFGWGTGYNGFFLDVYNYGYSSNIKYIHLITPNN